MTTGGERSDRVRRSMASRRSSSRSCASSSVRGTMPGAVPSGNVSPVVGSKAGVTCPPRELRTLGGERPLGGGGVERRARLNVLYALAEFQLGAIAGDPLGLNE